MTTTLELLKIINKNDNLSIDDLLKKIPDLCFVDYLETLMMQKGITKSQLIQYANIDRTYGYQILNGTKKPSRIKVIQIALSLQLTQQETNNLLSLSDNGSLYPKVKFDAIILLALKNHYSVIDTNLLLDKYHLPILF